MPGYNAFVINKHFFKTLFMFTGLILVGLLGIFLVSYFFEEENAKLEAPIEHSTTPVAK